MKKGRKKTVQAILLADGKGTKLRPLTLFAPRPAVPLASRSVLIAGTVEVGEGCRIDRNVTLENCVLRGGAEVGAGAKLRGALVGRKAGIGARTHLGGHAVPDDRAHLAVYSHIGGSDSGSLP